jgi:hypothetical protein
MDRTGAINAKVHATKSYRNFSLRTHPIHTIGLKTQVLVCFVMFGCTWDRFATALNLVQNRQYWCNWCKSSCHEVASELVTTNAPDPHHWTPNSCFSVSRNVWVHLGPSRYCTKLGAKWAELVQLMQKFIPRSRVGTFCYKRVRCKPLDSKLMFCCISQSLGAFGIVSLLH